MAQAFVNDDDSKGQTQCLELHLHVSYLHMSSDV